MLFEKILGVYILINFLIYFVQKWLERQLEDRPHGRKLLYEDCEWYKNPQTIKHHIAKKLVDSKLPYYEDAEYIFYVSLFVLGFFAFVVIFLSSNSQQT
jgi:hypothetical protein